MFLAQHAMVFVPSPFEEKAMRILIALLALLLGTTAAHAQSVVAEPLAPPAPQVQVTPASAPSYPVTGTLSNSEVPAEAASIVPEEAAQQQEPRQRSRAVWVLVGAVIVLAIVLAATI
jgi:hypothetical protein